MRTKNCGIAERRSRQSGIPLENRTENLIFSIQNNRSRTERVRSGNGFMKNEKQYLSGHASGHSTSIGFSHRLRRTCDHTMSATTAHIPNRISNMKNTPGISP